MNILNLPDEMLLTIFMKLNMIDMLYSLVDVNQRFDRLVLDSLHMYHLSFATKRDDIHNPSVNSHILDRVCEQILPRINERITKFTLEPLSVKRVLDTIHYPQLHSLSFDNFDSETLLEYLTDETLINLLGKQIRHITVDINTENVEISNIFLRILCLGKCLSDLIFPGNLSEEYLIIPSFNIPYENFLSSTLTKLKINVKSFNDCLLLLNGCLESLSILIIHIDNIQHSLSIIDSTKKLVKLKCFSLATHFYVYNYDSQVVPLLCRMLNLEELTLFLPVLRSKPIYIDGNHLYDEVLNYMPQLNKFLFSIHTDIMNYCNRTNLPSNDDIRNSFIKRGFQSIDAYVDTKFINHKGNCHIYSLPYQFNDFIYMNSCFQGGKFDNVRLLSMEDTYPFEYELFKIISQDFPFLQQLHIYNRYSQKNKQHHSSTLVTFNHLFKLDLYFAHSDYVIQFLEDKNTRLPCLTNLEIRYETLTSVTNNFTNDATRLNCAKIKSFVTHNTIVHSQNFYLYFPSL